MIEIILSSFLLIAYALIILGTVSLYTMLKYATEASSVFFIKDKNELKEFIKNYRKNKELLFLFGLSYLENTTPKVIYFSACAIVIIISCIFILFFQSSLWMLYISGGFVITNIMVFLGTKYDMKKLYTKEKRTLVPSDVQEE